MIPFFKWAEIMLFPAQYRVDYAHATNKVYREAAPLPIEQFDERADRIMHLRGHYRVSLRHKIKAQRDYYDDVVEDMVARGEM